jgi:hypothetical protein
VLTQPPRHVVDVDDGVVDEGDEGHRKARQGHRVHRDAAEVQHESRRHQRHRDHHGADQRGAPFEEEGAQDEDEKDPAYQQRTAEVVERLLDEGRRAVDRGVDLHAGETGAHRVERRIDPPCDLGGVGLGELLDDEQEALPVTAEGVADQRLVIRHQLGHVTEVERLTPDEHRPALGILDRDQRELLGRGDGLLVEDMEPLIHGIDEPAGPRRGGLQEAERRHLQGIPSGPDDLVERDVLIRQPLRVHQHLQLPIPEAPDRHVRHAVDAQQTRDDHPPSEHRHLDRRQPLRRQLHHPDPARRGQGLQHLRRLRHLRQPGHPDRLRESLRHDLACIQQVGPGLERHDYRRQPRQRRRLDLVEERHPVEQVLLKRDRDELLDLLRGEPKGLRLDLDPRWGELGEDVHRRIAELRDAEDHESGGDGKDQAPDLQTRANDPTHHGAKPPCAVNAHLAPGHPVAGIGDVVNAGQGHADSRRAKAN